jgi:hypothetical protein
MPTNVLELKDGTVSHASCGIKRSLFVYMHAVYD